MSTGSVSEAAAAANPNDDFEVTQPPDDTISALEFSPATMRQTYLISGGWDNTVRCWEVGHTGQTLPRAMQSMSETGTFAVGTFAVGTFCVPFAVNLFLST